MRKILTSPPQNAAAAQHQAMERKSVAPKFQLTPTLPRVATGLTAAVAGVSAAFFVFGPFSDLSAMQLAAGPHGSAIGPNGKPIVLARTGRSWGAEAEVRASAASGVPLAKLARAATTDTAYGPGSTK